MGYAIAIDLIRNTVTKKDEKERVYVLFNDNNDK